ncbi:aldehyde dehydrogenase family protein [Ktedonosporobacter rubrisoli]|uniref:Aldehyde dehydrogenase family protein n=1 Tax=Ktedonosporobacter rubrisoli TaxID=2509675 RepID=A0A4P6JIS7_KTERU|nr:aldehyde dehydrogenase family protein [Ktedonosporobacter rubrisoli]QBD74556.1 aldehyde dehydrogenase family protein [Ktedonosporobacter rubrisoli]
MKMLLDGAWVERSQQIEVRDPQDARLIDTVPRANREDMYKAIDAAVRGAALARTMPTHQRTRILREAADNVKQRHEEFARMISREGIKTIREARKEVTRCIETLRLSAEAAHHLEGSTIAFDQMPGSERRHGYYFREPVGIIGAITPFNDPLNLVAHKVGPALAAGNAIIVKPHTATPLSALLLARACVEAGLPPGVLQVITGRGPEVGEVLIKDPRVRMISFTGGRQTGEMIQQQARLKKVGMELGSNSPVIVMPDADLELAVKCSVSGAYWAAGQNCLHVQRLFLHSSIANEFIERFLALTKAYRTGDKQDEATDMGPLINEAAALRVEKTVKEALLSGARALTGAQREGTYFMPTLLENVPDTSPLALDEIYGPVTTCFRFDTIEEALQLANAVDYGLQAGIFTRDIHTAFRAIHGLQCGGVMVNDSSDYRIDAMPFGGVKGSGIGREGVDFALQEMTEPKVVCFNLE